jgi:tRNA(Ile)-lysidine synthase
MLGSMSSAPAATGAWLIGRLAETLDRFFTERAPLSPGERLLVAFSGGPDSTALLRVLRSWAGARHILIHAAHLDHAADPHSAERAKRAAEIAATLEVPLTAERLTERLGEEARHPRRGYEEAARSARYAFLERVRAEVDARYIATAHHRDDQVESVLLRILQGSGLPGLGGIAEVRERLARPLLAWSRRDLATIAASVSPAPVNDPTNRDTTRPRNRLRHVLLPRLEDSDRRLRERALALGAAATAARSHIEAAVRARLGGGPENPQRPHLEALNALPRELWPYALGILHRERGARYPPGEAALAELRRAVSRSLATGARVGCDAGGGWRWESEQGSLALVRRPLSSTPPAASRFAYTLEPPGTIRLPEIGRSLSLTRQEVAPWMFRGSPTRAALDLDLPPGRQVTLRSRRPGDRIRPLGCTHSRRLKEVLIDGRIPRRERSRLPLLCVEGRIVWVPGVTIDESCRIANQGPVWVAELFEEPEE